VSAELAKHQQTTPATLDGAVRFAQLLSDADLLPRQFVGKPANVLYAVEYGRTLGITPVAAITGIHVIEGKPSASSGLIGALVRKAGHKLRVKSDGMSWATAQIVRADDPEFTYECTWNLQRAEQAGLLQIKDGKPFARDRNGKPTAWEKYTAAMLKARAITEVARDACEDVLFGLHYTPEELGANVNASGEVVEADVQPLRRVQPGETDQWATATPVVTTEQKLANAAGLSSDPAHMRDLYQQARDAGLLAATVKVDGESLELGKFLIARGQQLAAPTPEKTGEGDGEVLEGEVIETGPNLHGTPADANAATAEKELRAAAQAAGLANLDEEFERSYGLPIDMAGAQQLREMTAILTGSAA